MITSNLLQQHNLFFHGFFDRHGGVSPPPWDSLNVSHGVGDHSENVVFNRNMIKKRLNFKCLISARQIHGTDIHHVEKIPENAAEITGYDAFITDIAGIGLMVQQADCQAVVFADPVRLAVGIAHTGWRGSVANIIAKTIQAMKNTFLTDPADLMAAISPSLGPCCAEFINYRKELPAKFHKFKNNMDHFNFWDISRSQLENAGVQQDNISIASVCTVCNKEYFSYRREGNTGRGATIIGIKDEA